MSYQFYKILHLSCVFFLLSGVVGLIMQYAFTRGQKSHFHKTIMMLHGLGLLGLLVSGFGLLAKLGIPGLPGWVGAKLVIWLIFGGWIVLCRKFYGKTMPLLFGTITLAITAGYLAVFQPL